jgi:hypothetical protein
VASIEKLSKESVFTEGIEEESLDGISSVRFNPVTTVVGADGIRVDSALHLFGRT